MSAVSVQPELGLPLASSEWIGQLPDGAVSIEADGRFWKLRASQAVQTRFEDLLERKKTGQLSPAETQQYDALCDLDVLLSGFNRLVRRVQS
jgi:hypothetical protein